MMLVSTPAYVFASPLNAQANPGNRADMQENPGTAARERVLEFRCEVTSSKMDMMMSRYRTNFERHHDTYKNIVTRVSDVLDQLEEKGFDVTEARTALAQFNEEIDKAQTDFDGFAYQIEQSRGTLCQNGNENDFKQSLNRSRLQLQEVRKSLLMLRSRYQRDVKPALLELREQVRNAQDGETVPGDVVIK